MLWNETVTLVTLGLRGSHAGPALHEIVCNQITAGYFEVGGWEEGVVLWPFFIETTEEILAQESCSREHMLGHEC